MRGKCVDCLCWWHIEGALLGRSFCFLCRLEQFKIVLRPFLGTRVLAAGSGAVVMDILEVIPFEKEVLSAASSSVGQLWRDLVLLKVVYGSLQLVDLPKLDGHSLFTMACRMAERCGRNLRESEAAEMHS